MNLEAGEAHAKGGWPAEGAGARWRRKANRGGGDRLGKLSNQSRPPDFNGAASDRTFDTARTVGT